MDFSKAPGRCRFAESGLGWKPSGSGDTFTLGNEQIQHAFWNRAARGYEVKIYRKNDPVVQFDGFQEEDYERISKIFKNWYAIPFDKAEHSLRGWNWGKAEFGKAELSFNVQSRSAFEIPYTEVSNTNLAGKGEVAVEFSLPGDGAETGTNGHLGGARAAGNKAGAARDQLVEMRFYIPGMTSVKTKDEDGEDGEVDEDAEEQQAADAFYQTLSEKAEIGEVAGDTIATFQDVLHLTPRYVAKGHLTLILLMRSQRTIRYRHVPNIIPFARQDIRLQDPVRLGEEVYDPTKTGRNTCAPHNRSGSTSTARSNTLSIRCHANDQGRRTTTRTQHEGRGLRGRIQGEAATKIRGAAPQHYCRTFPRPGWQETHSTQQGLRLAPPRIRSQVFNQGKRGSAVLHGQVIHVCAEAGHVRQHGVDHLDHHEQNRWRNGCIENVRYHHGHARRRRVPVLKH